MRTISITSNNRPEYLKECFESLSRNNHLKQYDTLYCQLEPGDRVRECADICMNVKGINTNVVINQTKLGVRMNPFNLLKRVFEEVKSDFNVYLEDDIIISPDCLDLVECYINSFKQRYVMLSFYNYASDPGKAYGLTESTEMVSLGMAFTRDNWVKQIAPYWNDENIVKELGVPGTGWDWSIRAAILRNKWKVLMPTLSRSKHIGKYLGTHCSPEEHINRFEKHPYSMKRYNDEGFSL